jgi:hypothetical protein
VEQNKPYVEGLKLEITFSPDLSPEMIVSECFVSVFLEVTAEV